MGAQSGRAVDGVGAQPASSSEAEKAHKESERDTKVIRGKY